MSFQPPANLYSQGGGTRPESVEVPFTYNRDPLPTDNLYPIGKKWVNFSGNRTWTLTSFVNNMGSLLAQWQLEGSAIGDIRTITGNSGGAVAGDSVNQNVNLLGTAGQVVVTGNPGTNTLTLSLAGGGEAIDTIIPGSGTNVVPDASGNVHFPNGNGIATVGTLNTLTTNMATPFTGNFEFAGNLNVDNKLWVGSPNPTFAGFGNSTAVVDGSQLTPSYVQFSTQNTSTGGALIFPATASGPAIFGVSIAGVIQWVWGMGNSVGPLVFYQGSEFATGLEVLSITQSGIVNIPNILTVNNAVIAGGGTPASFSPSVNPIQAVASRVGNAVVLAVTNNDNTNPASGASVSISTGGTSAGDPYIFMQGPATSWTNGIAHADSSYRFVTGTATPSTGVTKLAIATTGAVTFNNAFTFPVADGTTGQTLVTNGTGVVSWGSAAGGAKIFGVFIVPASTGAFSMGNSLNVVSATCTATSPNVICQINFASGVISGSSSDSNTIINTTVSNGAFSGTTRSTLSSATQLTFTFGGIPDPIGAFVSFSIFQNP